MNKPQVYVEMKLHNYMQFANFALLNTVIIEKVETFLQ